MTKLEKKLRAGLRKLGVSKTDRILVAASGGADSTALLDALARWKKSENLLVAHLNHQLRGEESDADETFVRELAERLRLPMFVARENVAALATKEKKNLEATARRVRYDFLLRTALRCQAAVIVTAHTQNDQVETILMRLLRGTSGAGLEGIYTISELSDSVRLLRPLLEITRLEVLEHCARYQLAFCRDSSNESLEFTRNRVRHELFPLLQTFNPAIGKALIRMAAQGSEDDACLQAEAKRLVDKLAEGHSLNFHSLLTVHPALRRRVLRQWLARACGDLRRLGTVHLLAVDHLMMKGEGGSYVQLPNSRKVVRLGKTLKLQPICE